MVLFRSILGSEARVVSILGSEARVVSILGSEARVVLFRSILGSEARVVLFRSISAVGVAIYHSVSRMKPPLHVAISDQLTSSMRYLVCTFPFPRMKPWLHFMWPH